MKKKVATRLRQARENAGLSKKQVHLMTGASYSTLNNWEKGIWMPNAFSMYKLCKAYKVNLEYFFSDV